MNLLSYSMGQSLYWEANRFSASQEILHILWNPKVHYRSLKCPPPVPMLRQLDPVHTRTSHFLKIYLIIIPPSTPGSPKWSPSFNFPTQTLYTHLPYPIRATCPAHIFLLDFIHRTIFGEQYRSLSSPLCSFLHSPLTSSLLGLNSHLGSKGVPRQAEVLGVPVRLKPRIISTFGATRVVGRQPNTPAAFTPGEIPGTHCQRLSRPQGTWFCRKEPRKKNPQWHHRESIPGPSD